MHVERGCERVGEALHREEEGMWGERLGINQAASEHSQEPLRNWSTTAPATLGDKRSYHWESVKSLCVREGRRGLGGGD